MAPGARNNLPPHVQLKTEVQSDHFFITLLTREFLLIWCNFLQNFCWNSSCCVP